MRVLVTGAGGFLGRALTVSLADDGHDVVAMDNDFRGNLNTLPKKPNITEVHCDILDHDKLFDLTKGFDAVYHLAYINGTKYFYEIPAKILEVGIIGTHNILKACMENNVGNFFLASSSEVYQYADQIPTPENVECKIPDVTNPRYSYGGGKITCELLTINYLRSSKTKWVIFRPHNIYGPQMGYEHVIPELIGKVYGEVKKAANNEIVIKIQGTGKETRSFMFINDAVDAIKCCTINNNTCDIYHIGNVDEKEIFEIVNIIGKHLKLNLKVETSEALKGATPRRCPDNRKIKDLGYVQKITVEEGIKHTVDWYWADYSKITCER